MNRLADLGEKHRTAKAEKIEGQRSIVRSALDSAGMAETCDQLRDIFGARMTYLKVGDLEIGTPDTERGITGEQMILLDWERKQKENALAKKGGRN